jgi:hypothetical protein
MSCFKRCLRFFGFTPLIKIEGKNDFDQLTLPEVGVMIDAFLDGSNDYFDALAFNDFLHAHIKNPELKQIQIALNEHAFLPARKGVIPEVNIAYLRATSGTLRACSKKE